VWIHVDACGQNPCRCSRLETLARIEASQEQNHDQGQDPTFFFPKQQRRMHHNSNSSHPSSPRSHHRRESTMASSSYPMTQIGARRESNLFQLPSPPTSKKKELILVTIYSFQPFPERRSRGRIRSFARSCATRSWEAVVMFRQGKPGSPNVSTLGS